VTFILMKIESSYECLHTYLSSSHLDVLQRYVPSTRKIREHSKE